ncbi:Phosphatidylserine decarboxylase [Alteripontixanthobacter maritimus]|uniref:Phosphatidylserine decarboxylase proenzyme n=1 Tax=Alteripontixanthobacter maritimus TaxID=2161824 RepID=A0A369QAT8_9SPHN|nr:phosphatidylserine decarboxylase [Alteripontixanthobacter maritimus]RDC60347.1 Phosphatidylserine decarboxylase [Alteripontixanthobacter maritimus]
MAGNMLDNRGGGDGGWSFPAIHPEGRRFGLIAIAISLAVLLVLDWELLGWPMLALSAGVFAFFRDPERAVPQGSDLLLSPADGRITQIAEVEWPRELAAVPGLATGPVWRVSIFMSVFDVHINRAPIAGSLRDMIYMPGEFANADLDKASERNERQHMIIERGDGTVVALTQIAGLIARRIVPFVKNGDILAAGQRIGLIRFGSRVDVYLPAGTQPAVLMGQKTVAGETVLAHIGQSRLIEGIAL